MSDQDTVPAPKPTYPAWIATEGTALATHTIHAYLGPHSRACLIPQINDETAPTRELAHELRDQVEAVNAGNMEHMEALLVSQAYTLNAMFHRLATQAQQAGTLKQYDASMKFALRAQSQCRATIETLSAMKPPPAVAYVQQANIAHNQQVNNGTTAIPPITHLPPQLEHTYGNYLDTGTAQTALRNESSVATVGEIHGTKDTGGQG